MHTKGQTFYSVEYFRFLNSYLENPVLSSEIITSNK